MGAMNRGYVVDLGRLKYAPAWDFSGCRATYSPMTTVPPLFSDQWSRKPSLSPPNPFLQKAITAMSAVYARQLAHPGISTASKKSPYIWGGWIFRILKNDITVDATMYVEDSQAFTNPANGPPGPPPGFEYRIKTKISIRP